MQYKIEKYYFIIRIRIKGLIIEKGNHCIIIQSKGSKGIWSWITTKSNFGLNKRLW